MTTRAKLESVVADIADEMRAAPGPRRGRDLHSGACLHRSDAFGLAVIDADGNVALGGDAETPFSIQSISKVFTLTLALGKDGDRLWRRVGREPSGSPFNSIVQLEREQGIPRNPFINAGAIAVTDLILSGHQPREALGEILRFMQFVADDPSIQIDEAVAASEQRTGFRNVALANYMKSFGVLDNPVDLTLGVYFHQCAIAMSCRQLAMAGRFLAHHGRNPSTGLSVVTARARAAHQRADADLRPLRRIRGIRLPGRPAGQERRRRRHSGDRARQGLDRRVVAGPRPERQLASRPHRARGADQRMGWSIFGARSSVLKTAASVLARRSASIASS